MGPWGIQLVNRQEGPRPLYTVGTCSGSPGRSEDPATPRQPLGHGRPIHTHSFLSRVQLFATPGTVAHQAPLSMGRGFKSLVKPTGSQIR